MSFEENLKNIDAEKRYTTKEASQLLNLKTRDAVVYYLKKGYIESEFVRTIRATPKYKKKVIKGQGLINYMKSMIE